MSTRVSIVMPCYNCAAHLPDSIGSVLAQTWAEWELIVVDDGSTDASAAIVGTMDDPRIRLIQQANAGVSAARNRALDEAGGEYVAFLDADDTWSPTFLEKMVRALDTETKVVLVYCGWQNLGLPGGRGAPFVPPDYETTAKLETLFGGCRWPIHAALTRRTAVIAAGGFNPHYANAEDYALWLEVAGAAPIVRVPEVLAFYHFHGDAQASANVVRAALQLLEAQQSFIRAHPDFSRSLGWSKRRRLTYGALLKSGYECYWMRDLRAAQTIFHRVMSAGYGRLKDWKYMLPALLPLDLYQLIVQFSDTTRRLPTQADSHTTGEH